MFAKPDANPNEGVSGGIVTLLGADGATKTLRTNAAGNFYTSEALAFPLTVSVSIGGVTKSMTSKVASSGCSSCHGSPGVNGAPGRLYSN